MGKRAKKESSEEEEDFDDEDSYGSEDGSIEDIGARIKNDGDDLEDDDGEEESSEEVKKPLMKEKAVA